MTIRVISCGACGADVPHGRLSCPACGELLASVSGAVRGAPAAAMGRSGAASTVLAPDDRPLVDALLDDDPEPILATAAVAGVALPVADEPALEPESEPEPAGSIDDPQPDVELVLAGGVPGPEMDPDLDPGLAWPAASATATPDWPDPEAPSWPDRAVAPALAAAAPAPGAYLPPTAVPPPAPPAIVGTAAVAAMPAGPAAPARAWAGPAVEGGAGTGEADQDAAAARAGLDEAIGWVAVGACTISLLGFLIPWARTVIGSAGASYLDQWGLAGPGHLVIVLALGLILAGAIVPNRIPAWIRLGVPGLVVGAILIGLVWPYVLGPLDALPGAFLSLAGAVTLVVASIAAIVVDRHATRRPAV
jgi:hypothetical protein